MEVQDYFRSAITALKSDGVGRGLKTAGRDLAFGVYHNLPVSYGTPSFEREWDALIILDACRPDLMSEVSDQYEFLPSEIPTTYSVASRSDTWMRRNFSETYRDEIARTAYVTANPYSDSVCSDGQFEFLDEVWRYAWDERVGSVAAEDVTDRGIAAGRKQSYERIIIHYMQPHFPSIPEPIGEGIDLDTFATEWDSVWNRLKNDAISQEVVWKSYRKNLEYVLDSVRVLLKNLDAEKTIISADHANAFGEWGLWGHPINKPAPVLRRVPWVPVTAVDTGTRTPNPNAVNPGKDSDVEERLEALGYKH